MPLKNKIGIVIGGALILTWCLLPVVWIISLSFKSQESITVGNPGFFPSAGTVGRDEPGAAVGDRRLRLERQRDDPDHR